MTTYVALVRGINVGGHKPVAMADLRDLLTRLGLGEARSLLQSGNLVFRADSRTGASLERLLETEARARLGLETDFFVRSAEEWKAVVAGNPFPEVAKSDPGHLLVLFLRAAPRPADVKALQATITGRELVRAGARHAYVSYPDGVGRSRLTIALIEKHLRSSATGRNWNTVRKLAALAGG